MQCYDKDIVPIAFNMLSCMIFCNLAMQLKWRERERGKDQQLGIMQEMVSCKNQSSRNYMKLMIGMNTTNTNIEFKSGEEGD